MAKHPHNAVAWTARKFSCGQERIENLLENMPDDLKNAEEVVVGNDDEIKFIAHGQYLQMIVVDGEMWNISFSFAQELLEPISDQDIYTISRLFIKG